MSAEDRILDFLAAPENISTAFEIAEKVEKLKEKVHYEFHTAFSAAAEERLASSELWETWKFIPLSEIHWQRNWGTYNYRPRGFNLRSNPVLDVCLQQGNADNDYRLLVGVQWTSSPVSTPEIPEYRSFVEKIKTLDLKYSNKDWPGWNWLPYKVRSEEFILRMKEDPEHLVDEVLDALWALLMEVYVQVEEVNRCMMQDGQPAA